MHSSQCYSIAMIDSCSTSRKAKWSIQKKAVRHSQTIICFSLKKSMTWRMNKRGFSLESTWDLYWFNIKERRLMAFSIEYCRASKHRTLWTWKRGRCSWRKRRSLRKELWKKSRKYRPLLIFNLPLRKICMNSYNQNLSIGIILKSSLISPRSYQT